MTTPLDIVLADMVRSARSQMPPVDTHGIQFEIHSQVMHKTITKLTPSPLGGASREDAIRYLITNFIHYFGEYHVDLLAAMTFSDKEPEMGRCVEFAWGKLMNHMHLAVSNAYAIYDKGFDVRELRPISGQFHELVDGVPIVYARAINMLVVWAGAHGMNVLSLLQNRGA